MHLLLCTLNYAFNQVLSVGPAYSCTCKLNCISCFVSAIKSALKEENLNPDIEEKLLQLQRYQDQQMKHDKTGEVAVQPQVTAGVISKAPAKKRASPVASQPVNQPQEDWESAPKRKIAKLDTRDAK
jgi:hypothetical protein